eukprot:scaffold132507_cov30-Tisochrysis_lutea.AAC.1
MKWRECWEGKVFMLVGWDQMNASRLSDDSNARERRRTTQASGECRRVGWGADGGHDSNRSCTHRTCGQDARGNFLTCCGHRARNGRGAGAKQRRLPSPSLYVQF